MRVQDYMTPRAHAVAVATSLVGAFEEMQKHEVATLAVVDSAGCVVGALSRIDLMRIGRSRARVEHRGIALDLPAMSVEAVMSRPALTVSGQTTMRRAAELLVDKKLHRLFIVDEQDRPIGVLSTTDVMRAVRDARLAVPLSKYMSSPVETIEANAALGPSIERLAHAPLSGYVVTDSGTPVGLFTQREALESRGLPEHFVVEDAMSQAMLALPMNTPLFRAAGFTESTRARRVLAVDHHHIQGILTGLDFARAFAVESAPSEPRRNAARAERSPQ